MTDKHTFGPWFRDQYGHIYGTTEARPLRDFPGASVIDHPHVCTPKNPADIDLIAAAPDLLNALRSMIDVCHDHERDDATIAAIRFARAAIAKAQGTYYIWTDHD